MAADLWSGWLAYPQRRPWGTLLPEFFAPKRFSECFLYGSLIMQIDFDLAGDAAKISAELKDQQTAPEADKETLVAANDNGLRWPLILFPEGWYASF